VVTNLLVLHIIARMNFGGTAKYLIALNNGLNKSGIYSIIASGSVQKGEIDDPDVVQARIIRIKSMGRKISLRSDLNACKEIREIIANSSPDIINTHTFKAGLLTRFQRNRIENLLGKKVKFVHTFHGHLFEDPEFRGIKGIVIKFIEKKLAKKTDQLIAVGEKVKSDLNIYGIRGLTETQSIPPTVRPLKIATKNFALKKYNIKEKKRIRVLWMARVTRVKNPKRVIQIASELPEIDFFVAGGGDLLDDLVKMAPKNVKVIGWQDPRKILALADIFLSTSENEGMPIALIEAQLAKIPVVATNVGSVSEVVIHNETGFICGKSNYELATAIKKLAEDQKLRELFGRNARTHALKNFSEKKFIHAHKKLYNGLVGNYK
jgi:glycosyltransferase involved in cell wall biosynthesis